jgi:hypothetical protein
MFIDFSELSRAEGKRFSLVMDRAIFERHLALAEEHVSKSQKHIGRQRELIEELERDGHLQLALSAERLLAQFIELDALHVAHRDRLRLELSGSAT